MIAFLRTVLTLVLAGLATLAATPAFIIVASRNPASPTMDRIAAMWAKVWLLGLGIHPEVRFDATIPPGGYVVVGNHESNLDPMCHYLAFPSPLRFLAKKELYSVPVFGWAIRATGMIEVDRSKPSMDAINAQVAETVARGRSIIVYPEGHRTTTGELGPFKKGAFVIAIQTGLPIVPVATQGTYEIWPPGAKLMHPGPIHLHFGEPIPTTGMTLDDAESLKERAREWIESALRA
ncbi:MAG: lysophospholipid acyltransferase family protein [Acidimicrobiia bacterium]